MTGKLFLIHWNEAEAELLAEPFRSEGCSVEIESSDGARAGKQIKAQPPDVIVIYLTRLPSHGRETAHGLRSLKATRHLPIVFVDGNEEALEKTRAKVPDAIYTTSGKVRQTLAEVIKSSREEADR